MKTPQLFRTALAGVFIAAMPLTVTAVTSTPTPTPKATATPKTTATPNAAQAQRLNNLKAKGTAEIDRRLAGLNAALEKLGGAAKLAAADKAALTQQIQTQISGLTALKTKLAAETELAAARADVASIVTDYRVYALTAPKTRMVAAIDRLTVSADKLSELQAQLRIKVDAANASSSSGVSADQQKVDAMATKIAAAKAVTDGMTAKLLAIQPTDYNANHAVLVDYRAKTKTAFDNLKAARDDAKDIITSLKAAKK